MADEAALTDTERECPRCAAAFEGIGAHCRECVIAIHKEAQARGPVVVL